MLHYCGKTHYLCFCWPVFRISIATEINGNQKKKGGGGEGRGDEGMKVRYKNGTPEMHPSTHHHRSLIQEEEM